MPEPTSPHDRTVKKRKTSETHHSIDDYASSDEFGFLGMELYEQSRRNLNANGKGLQETHKTEALKVSEAHQREEGPPLKYPLNSSLRECMETIMGELREARENLLRWMRQEMQAVSANNGVKGGGHINAEKRKGKVDHGLHIGSTGMQSGVQGFQAFQGSGFGKRPSHSKHENIKPLDAADGHQGYGHSRASHGIIHKGLGLISLEPKSAAFDMAIKSGLGAERNDDNGLGAERNDANGLDQGLQSNVNGKAELGQSKMGSSFHNPMGKLPAEDMCFGAGLGEDTKDADGLCGSLESGVNSTEGFEFSKASHDIQKGLERLPAETKSAFFDMGFEDEESNEGDGLGCSLESAASGKENSGFSKASNGIQNGFSRAFNTGCAAVSGEQSKEDGGLESAANCADVFGFGKARTEGQRSLGVVSAETKEAVFGKGVAANTRGVKAEVESKHVDSMGGCFDVAQAAFSEHLARRNKSHIGASFSAQSSQPGDAHQQSSISSGFGCGIKRPYGSAMTFKGSALESGNDGMKPSIENLGSAEVFNSATSSIGVMKLSENPSHLPAADKGKVGLLGLHNQSSTIDTPSSVPMWNMLSTTRNTVNPTLHDSKLVHLEYASRSKLGDVISGSGTTLNFTGLDSHFSYASQSRSSNGTLGAYQGWASTSPMYFSSLCTNNSDFLTSSNGVMGMQLPPPRMQSIPPRMQSTPPSSSSSMRPMMMGMPGNMAAHQDPSSIHTFLGLGMNGLSRAANEYQVFPGLYLQGNPQHNQASSKQAPSSASLTVSQQRSPAVQERGILELNF